jgi:hypothetical protein
MVKMESWRRAGAALTATVVLLAGCASPRNAELYPAEEKRLPKPTGTCIYVRTIQDFRVEDAFSLLVRTRATGWQYKVELNRRCTQLPFAQAVGWTSQQGRVCDYRHDAVLVRGDRCGIGRITTIEEESGGEEGAPSVGPAVPDAVPGKGA